MNAIKSGGPMLSKWSLAAIAVTSMIIFGVVMWATSADIEPSVKVDIDRTPRTASSGAGPSIGYENPPPQTYVPPVPIRMPPTRDRTVLHGGGSGAVVKVTPVRTMPPLQAPKQSASKSAEGTKAAVATHDMFPMGNILRDEPKPADQEKALDELFPSFDYEGKLWQHTGKFASVAQIDIISTGFEFEGRKVYAFTESSVSAGVLFVQSTQDPNKFAIYR